MKDFEPVTLIADTPQWIVARASFPAKDLKEMVAWMKANPGKATAGTVGVGGPADIAAIYFQRHTGTTFQIVPYKGGAPLIQDLIARADRPHVRPGGELPQPGARRHSSRPSRCSPAKRWWASPETPTIDEAGGPDLYSSFWHGLWVAKGTPKDVIAKLNAAVSQALEDPAVKKRFADIGQEIWPRRAAEPGGAGGAAEGRDRTLVADHQGRRHQVTVNLLDAGTAPASRRIGHSDSKPGRNNALYDALLGHDASTHIAARAIPNDTIVNATATDTASANVSATNA